MFVIRVINFALYIYIYTFYMDEVAQRTYDDFFINTLLDILHYDRMLNSGSQNYSTHMYWAAQKTYTIWC